jgi:hypothetical protein
VCTRHVISIAAFSITEQDNRAITLRFTCQDCEPGSFAKVDPVSFAIERSASVGGDQLQRVKAVNDAQAKTVDTADDNRISYPTFDPAGGAGKGLGARRGSGR